MAGIELIFAEPSCALSAQQTKGVNMKLGLRLAMARAVGTLASCLSSELMTGRS